MQETNAGKGKAPRKENRQKQTAAPQPDVQERKAKKAGGQDASTSAESRETSCVQENSEEKTLESRIAELEKQLSDKNDQFLRIAAEYDNFKKRTARERSQISSYALANAMKELLPGVDNIRRALESQDTESAEFAKGAVIVMKQMTELLEKLGLCEINPLAAQFNPEEHEAVMHVEDGDHGENEVVEVLQRGYKLDDTVLRPAMVKVAN